MPKKMPRQTDEVSHLLTAGSNLILLNKGCEVIQTLNAQRIDVLVLKGLYLAFSTYPDAALRPMSDIDFLVKKEDVNKVKEILSQLGYEEKWPGANRVYGYDACFCNKEKVYIDIRWDLCQAERFKGIIDMTDDFWSRKKNFKLNDIEAVTLCPEDHILHISLHYCLFDLLEGTNGIYDIFYLLEKFIVDWEKIIENAGKYNIKTIVYYTLLKVSNVTLIKIPDFVLNKLKPQQPKKVLLDYLLVRHKNIFTFYLAQALLIDGYLNALKIFWWLVKKAFREYIFVSPKGNKTALI